MELLCWNKVVRAGKNIVVLSVRDWIRVEAELGPLVPISAICKLVGRTKQAVWDRIHRGSCPVARVYGQAFVPLDYWSSGGGTESGVVKERDRQ